MRATWMMVLATLAIVGTMAISAHAATDNAAEIAKVEQYLSGLTTVMADFSQTEPSGKTSKGKFYLERPGKMRWQYAPPVPVLIVSDGKAVTYYDAELDQISYIGIDDTLAGFLAQKDIKLDSPTTRLTHFENVGDTIRATMVQKKKPDEGSLTLELSTNPMQLQRMEILDATGQVARVQLENAQFGKPLDKELFTFVDPRGNARRNR